MIGHLLMKETQKKLLSTFDEIIYVLRTFRIQ